jgi:hypothetical protein
MESIHCAPVRMANESYNASCQGAIGGLDYLSVIAPRPYTSSMRSYLLVCVRTPSSRSLSSVFLANLFNFTEVESEIIGKNWWDGIFETQRTCIYRLILAK